MRPHFAIPAALALSALPSPAHAESPDPDVTDPRAGVLVADGCANRGKPCRCADGSTGVEACDALGIFRFCGCAGANVVFGSSGGGASRPAPSQPPRTPMPPSRPAPPPPPRVPSPPSDGTGMLIGGLIPLGVGSVLLGIGIHLLDDDGARGTPTSGILFTTFGGVAMFTGLPLAAVGLAWKVTYEERLQEYRRTYPGRASASPALRIDGHGVGVSF